MVLNMKPVSDENLENVAGTGEYKNSIGGRVPRDTVFKQSLKTRHTFVIDQYQIALFEQIRG
jgi:hypothetical protein